MQSEKEIYFFLFSFFFLFLFLFSFIVSSAARRVYAHDMAEQLVQDLLQLSNSPDAKSRRLGGHCLVASI